MTMSDQPMDHVPPETEAGGQPEPSQLKENVKMRSTWIRLLFMLMFSFLYGISRLVTAAVVVIQFLHVLFTGETNEQLKSLGHSLAIYSYQVVDYLSFNSETRPFPLDAAWPNEFPQKEETPAQG